MHSARATLSIKALPIAFLALSLTLGICNICCALPQSGQAVKEELFREAANLLACSNAIEAKYRHYWQELEKAAVSQGELDLVEELAINLELKVDSNRRVQANDLLFNAIRYGDYELIRRLEDRIKANERLLHWLMDEIETTASFPAQSVESFEAIVKVLTNSAPFKLVFADETTESFEVEIKDEIIDQLRIRYIHGLIDQGKFSIALQQINEVSNQEIKQIGLTWWFANLPDSFRVSDSVQASLTDDVAMFAFARAYRAAKRSDVHEVLDWVDQKSSKVGTHSTVLVLRTLMKRMANKEVDRNELIEVLKRLIPNHVMLNNCRTPVIDSVKFRWKTLPRVHLDYLASRRINTDLSLSSLTQVCRQRGLFGEATELGFGFEDADEPWLIALVEDHLEHGEWKAAQAICTRFKDLYEWSLFERESYWSSRFSTSAAKAGDFEEAKAFRLKLGYEDAQLKLLCDYAIAYWKLEYANANALPNARKEFEEASQWFVDFVEKGLEGASLNSKVCSLFIVSSQFDEMVESVELRQPINQYLAKRYDHFVKLAMDNPGCGFSGRTAVDGQAYNSLASPSSCEFALVNHVHQRASESVKVDSMLEYGFLELDLYVRRAYYPASSRVKEPPMYSLVGTAKKIVHYACEYHDNDCQETLRYFLIKAAEQGDEAGVKLLVDATTDVGFRILSRAAAAKHFPPRLDPLRPWAHRLMRSRRGGGGLGGGRF